MDIEQQIDVLTDQIGDLTLKREELQKSRTDGRGFKSLRTFEHFPRDSICPICNTNDDGVTILKQTHPADESHSVRSAPVHLECAVVTGAAYESQFKNIRDEIHAAVTNERYWRNTAPAEEIALDDAVKTSKARQRSK